MGKYIICEAGSNHCGQLSIAKKLIDVAVEANSNAIKFQMFKLDKLFNKGPDWLVKYEFPKEWLPILSKYCQEKKIDFLVTPFDEASADLIEPYVDLYKIGSYELTHIPLLKHIAKKGKPIILSTGMSTMIEIMEAADVVKRNGCKDLTLMYCVSNYPTKLENLDFAKLTLLSIIDAKIGFSDHTEEVMTGAYAVSKGVDVIEKHFTLDKNMEGPDHKFAVNPQQLKDYIKNIRDAEKITEQNVGVTAVANSEKDERNYRRSIYASKDIKKDTMITEFEEKVVRPEGGLHPREYGMIRRAIKDVKEGDPITEKNSIPVAFCLISNKGQGHATRVYNLCKKKGWYPEIQTDDNYLFPDYKYVVIDNNKKMSKKYVESLKIPGRKLILIGNDKTDRSLFDEYFDTDDCLNPLLDKVQKKYSDKTILVSMGALDEDNFTEKFNKLLADFPANIRFVIGNQNKNFISYNSHNKLLYDITNDDMAKEMRKCHAGIILYGVTAKEAIRAELPFVCISSKDNAKYAEKESDENCVYIGTELPTKKKLYLLLRKLLK